VAGKKGFQGVAGGKGVVPMPLVNELVALSSKGEWAQLVAKSKILSERYPMAPISWKALGKGLLAIGQSEQSVIALRKGVTLAPRDADLYVDLGQAHQNLGQQAEAEQAYRKALEIDPKSASTLTRLGQFLTECMRYEEAVVCHQSAIQRDPKNAIAYNNLGNTFFGVLQLQEARNHYHRAVELNPQYMEAWINLGNTFRKLEVWGDSELCLRNALQINPHSPLPIMALSQLLGHLNIKNEECLELLNRLIALTPNNAEVYVELGNAHLRMKNQDLALEAYRRFKQQKPFITWLANKVPSDFSVVVLDAPFAGSTPINYLLGQAGFERHFYCVIPNEWEQDMDALKLKGDVIINVIGDADNGQDILPHALQICDALNRPTINHPRKILATDRESIANRLENTALCKVPRTIRVESALLKSGGVSALPEHFDLPILVRLAGTHGGDAVQKCDDIAAVHHFMEERPGDIYYVTEYVNYQSADGYFRKYRWICIDGEIFPYHLAIHTDWLVHYFRTDMGNHDWMRSEEEVFLKGECPLFTPAHLEALKQIAAATHLDYCGIDCGIDSQNRILVFEANATMLVHDEKEEMFKFKNTYVEKIKQAFDRLVYKMARGT
jgi:tetratricopeptide (TPR) repeat protein